MTAVMPVASALGLDTAVLQTLVQQLTRRQCTVAAAESLTAGLLTAVLTEVPGSSAVVRGGVVVYATELKHSLAGVPRDLLERVGPVHPDVALALADGARLRCGATYGIGLTGVAGPAPQDGYPVGTVHVAITGAGLRRSVALVPGADPTASRADVRAAAVASALDLLQWVVGAA